MPKSFRVLMRSPADVTVLEQPSWWTPAHALIVLALALTLHALRLGLGRDPQKAGRAQANQLRESEQKFRHLALHDSLTGLASPPVLEDRLKYALESIRRQQSGTGGTDGGFG